MSRRERASNSNDGRTTVVAPVALYQRLASKIRASTAAPALNCKPCLRECDSGIVTTSYQIILVHTISLYLYYLVDIISNSTKII